MDQTTTIEAPADTEIDIMKIAEQADAEPATTPAPAKTEQPPASGAQDEKKQDKQPAQGEQKPEQKAADQQPDDGKASQYEKSKKEAERRDRSWKALEAEKEAFRAEKARIDQELADLRRLQAQARQPAASTEPPKDKLGLTATDYDEMAKEYDERGKDDLARAARERAAGLRAQAATAGSAAAPSNFDSPDFQAKWQENIQALVKEDPTLTDPANPVVKAANALTTDKNFGRFFRAAPDGIRAAVEVARLMQKATAAQALTTELDTTKGELKTAKAEIERLTKLLSPQGSRPTGPAPGAKRPEEMNSDDIRALAAAADQGQ